jgi:hypothetical protein
MGISLPIADVNAVSGMGFVPPWFTTAAGTVLWSEIAKVAPDQSGRYIQSRSGNGQTWAINANEDDVTVQMAATPAPGINTGHQVVIECWLLNPGAQTVNLVVIDGNTSAVLSTGGISPTQTPTVYTYAIPAADVANNFLTTSYNNIYVKVARLNTPNPQDLYVDLLQFVTPDNTISLGAATLAAGGAVAALFGYEVALSATLAGSGSTVASAAGVDPLLGASAPGTAALSALLSIDQGMVASLAGAASLTASRPNLSPVSRRDLPFSSPLPKPVSRRDR